jgi:hypothetical protein
LGLSPLTSIVIRTPSLPADEKVAVPDASDPLVAASRAVASPDSSMMAA